MIPRRLGTAVRERETWEQYPPEPYWEGKAEVSSPVEDESQVVVSIPEEAVASSALEVADQDKPWDTVGKAVDESSVLDLGVRLGR